MVRNVGQWHRIEKVAVSLAAAIAATIALSGCPVPGSTKGSGSGSTSGSSAPAVPLTAVNASATLTGTAFGGNTVSDSSMEKSVPITVDSTSTSDLQVPASIKIFQEITGSTALVAAIPVKNVGTTSYSFVDLANIHYYDSTGTNLNATADNGYVYGSVGLLGTTYSNSCLAPGETGYVILVNNGANMFASTASIHLSIQTDATTPGDPGSSLIPQSYSVSGVSGNSATITQDFENTGTYQLDLNNNMYVFLMVIALDASGQPAMWDATWSSLAPSNGVIAPGQSGSASGSFSFDGTSNKIIAFTSFEVDQGTKSILPSSGFSVPNPADYSSHQAWLEAMLAARNSAIRSQEQAVQASSRP